MTRNELIAIASLTAVTFGILLAVGSSLSAQDAADDLSWRVDDVEARVSELE